MQFCSLGRTDLKVSKMCLGTMTFGEQCDAAQSHRILDRALEHGINFIDTAETYPSPMKAETYGHTERFIGDWLAQRGGRDKLVIATKVAGPAARLGYVRGGPKLVESHIRQAVDDSLQRLQTDYIDLYQIHWPARSSNYFGRLGYYPRDDEGATPLAETLAALEALRAEGKIRHVGLSNETPWGLMHALSVAKEQGFEAAVSLQNPYSLLNRVFEVGLAEICHREKVSMLAYSPLAFGLLSGKYRQGAKPEGARLSLWGEYFNRYTQGVVPELAEQYCAAADEHGVDAAQMALAFVLSRPFIDSTIIGVTDTQQLDHCVAAVDIKLAKPVRRSIGELHEQQPNPCP